MKIRIVMKSESNIIDILKFSFLLIDIKAQKFTMNSFEMNSKDFREVDLPTI